MNFISRSVARVLSSSLYHSGAAKLPTRKWVISRQITSDGRTPSPELLEYMKELSNSASGRRTETQEKVEYRQEPSNPVMAQTPNSVQDISPAATTISPPPEIKETITEKKPSISKKVQVTEDEIEETTTETKPSKTKKVRDIDEETSNSWKDLLENPKLWVDHRGNKANGLVKPRHPEFKRKKDGLPLWLNRAPDWVLPSLEGLEFDVRVPRGKSEQLEDALWKDLAQNPDNWFDNRLIKKNKKAPCFKHKETGVGLWMNKSPTWVLSKLPPIKKKQGLNGEESWNDLVQNPENWWDNRAEKTNLKAPDFKNKETREGLWVDRAPAWVLSKLPPPKKKQELKGEEFCNEFVQNLDQWCDNRSDKTNPKFPDFKNKKTGEGVWKSQLPTWVLTKLPPPLMKKEE